MPEINSVQPPLRETPHQTRTEQKTTRPDSQGTVQVKTNFDAQPMKAAVAESAKESKDLNPAQQSNLHNAPETTKQQVLSPPQMDIKQAGMKDGFNPASTVLRPKDKDRQPSGDDSARLKEQDAIGNDTTSAALQARNELENSSTLPRNLMEKVKQEIAETIGALSSLPQARGRLLLMGPDNDEMTRLAALLELAGYQAAVLTAVGIGSHYITTHPPDMLLLDLALDDYAEMFHPIANNPTVADVMVLALTSASFPLSEEEAPSYGFAGVVSKELPPQDFPKVVTELFVQLCPEKAGDAEGGRSGPGRPVTYGEAMDLERTLDDILGRAGAQGKQLRGFLMQVADMTKEAAVTSEQLKRLEALVGAPASVGNDAALQELRRFMTDAGEELPPLEKTTMMQVGMDIVQHQVEETRQRAAQQAMQLSARLLRLPSVVKDFVTNFGSVHSGGVVSAQEDADAFQRALDGIVGNAREQAHSLGDIVSRMEKGPPPQAHPAVLQQQGLDPAASALDILPGLAAVLGGLQQQEGA